MKMKKYMAMGLGAIMAVGIAVSGVLPVSAVNNNENDAKLATAVTMAARDYDDYEGVIKSNTTLRSKATSNSRKITTLKKGAVVEVERKASNGWYRVEYRDIEGYVSPKNIKIYDNTFKVFDAPLIRAVSTRALHFTGNKIIKTFDYKPYTWQQATFLLDGCRDVKINKNVFDSKYTTRDILIEHMRETDVQTDKKDKFIIKPIENLNTHMQWN